MSAKSGGMTAEQMEALARCDREIAEVDLRPDLETAPAYLVEMGRNDWKYERRLIEMEGR